ncbi:LapD/MoxY N-terminal periplasmic domain-containing protein [Pseudoalteromonas mariniglutinosa]|uniref:bifunctional diguanylate cyclase/phosphodiesterase n=1 Tax=Pseudoalteromonas mariniglutinosa TaxID=206042 RepID=UPI00384E7293
MVSIFNALKRNKNKTITLQQQLRIVILTGVFIGFISSVLISTESAKDYFATQLRLKNLDNANSLALMLSQMDKDPVEIELLISATFDTGHYSRIELVDPEHKPIIQRVYNDQFQQNTPRWFRYLYQLDVAPGVAKVSNGWQQFGTLYVESHSEYTEDALWNSAVKLFFSFFIVAVLACIAGAYFLAKILRPLEDVVVQATALGEKRFIKSKVPRTYEFARLVTSMNLLSSRFSHMILEDKRRLEEMRFKSQHDELTGLANREYFNATLNTFVEQSKEHAHGALFLFRVINLDNLTEQQSRVEMVSFLREFAKSLVLFLESHENSFAESQIARMSHADFVVLFSDVDNLPLLSERVLAAHTALVKPYTAVGLAVSHSCTFIDVNDTRASLLKRVDMLLKVAVTEPGCYAKINNNVQAHMDHSNVEYWQAAFELALKNNDFAIALHPVVSFSGETLQQQLSLCLILNGETYRSGFYYQWARRLNILARLDWGVIKCVVNSYAENKDNHLIAVELSSQTLLDDSAVAAILTYLSAFPELARRICFDIRASFAVNEISVFNNFCTQANSIGSKVALKRVGAEFTKLDKLQELGLEMLKIDSIYGHNISFNHDNQSFLRGICSLAHSLGIRVVAEEIINPIDQAMLKELGFDGLIVHTEEQNQTKPV